ncbi:MAG: hypothetical protein ACD_4C00199G0006 [uncultured bacterium (gcode 4)]|uniref:PrgI family protein n=1 Tax=uncultured bacterium (gcode 4) TaxID=1234023 RepID=K2FXS0_9BACT|nr:MAG: hypothetical protein ACD_4C00199G0006 [uncultured bacterium (gcode 4)]
MQYKIPVQIENEDKIILWLSLRQLTIIMIGWGIWYSLFWSLSKSVGETVAFFPAAIIILLAIVIALFKVSEMTFLSFILNMIRLNINSQSRVWDKWVDSFSNIEIGYIKTQEIRENSAISKRDHKAYQEIEDKLNKI